MPDTAPLNRRMTKSTFLRGYNCPLRALHAHSHLPSQSADADYLRHLAEGGLQFEKLIQHLWPGESLQALAADRVDSTEATLNRIRTLHRSGGVLHQAPLTHGAFAARIDMLRVEGDELILCEIKAKAATGPAEGLPRGQTIVDADIEILRKRPAGVSQKWVKYIADVAFQTAVAEKALHAAGIPLQVKPRLVVANREACCSTHDSFGNVVLIDPTTRDRRLTSADFTLVEVPAHDFHSPIVLEVDVSEAVRRLRLTSAQSTAESWKDLNLDRLMEEMARVLAGNIPAAESERGWKCRDCEFRVSNAPGASTLSGFDQCWGELAPQAESLFDLYYGKSYEPPRVKASQRWLHDWLLSKASQGRAGIGDLPLEKAGKARAAARALQIKAYRAGKTVVAPELSKRVGDRLLPSATDKQLHFVDFETATACLPYEIAMRPYEVIAFQFSCHSTPVVKGSVQATASLHREWLDPMDDTDKFGRNLRTIDRAFVDALRGTIGDEGLVIHWAAHEGTVVRKIASRLDPDADRDRIAWLHQLVGGDTHGRGRLVDMQAVADGRVMTPHHRGRYSMKKLLPAVCREDWIWRTICTLMDWGQHLDRAPADRDAYGLPSSAAGQRSPNSDNPHDELDPQEAEDDGIRCGTDAIRAYQQLRYPSAGVWEGGEQAARRASLKHYCKLDTAAMVAVWLWLTQLAGHRHPSTIGQR